MRVQQIKSRKALAPFGIAPPQDFSYFLWNLFYCC